MVKSFCIYFLFIVCIPFIHGQGEMYDKEDDYLKILKDENSTLTKGDKIGLYTDLGKINIHTKKYSQALIYLLKAKNLNKEDSSQYSHYYAAFGILFKELQTTSIAIEYYKKAYYSDITDLRKYFQASTIGALYLNINQLDSAILYFKHQLKAAVNLSDYIAIASSYNNIGIAYSRNKDQKKALSYFYKALQIMDENKSKKSENFAGEKVSFLNNVQSNIGQSFVLLNQYQKALNYIEPIYSFNGNYLKNRLFLERDLVQCYLKLNRIIEAKKIVSTLKPFYNKFSKLASLDFLNIELKISIYEKNYLKSSKLIVQIDKIQKLIDLDNTISNDVMNGIVSQLLISESKTKLNNEKRQKNHLAKMVQMEKKENIFITFLLIAICLIFIIIAYLYAQFSKNKRKQNQLEKDLFQLEDEKQKFKIKAQENYLTEFAIENNFKKEYSKELLKNLNHLMAVEEDVIKKEIKNLIFELKNKDLSDKNVEELNNESELLLFNFKTILTQLHPNLNKSDIELCSLLKLNLSNKEIAAHKNVTDDSIKIFKNRLKKKLNLNHDQNLNSYISNV